MKAAVLTGIRQIEVRDLPRPGIVAADDVLIRVGTVGVCGSDVHYYTTGRIGSQVVEYPYVVGHEGAGTVEAVGPGVTRVKPGERIAIEPAISCFECDQCRAGRPHTCRKLKFLGCPGQIEGCLAEYLVMPEQSCYPIPEGMTLTRAALSEPLAIGVYATRSAGPLTGVKAGILGAGPIGLSVMAAALNAGAATIFVTDVLDYRLEAARQAGASWTGNPTRQDVVHDIAALEPGGLDVVFECCGQQEALDQGIELLRPGGRLLIVGIPEVDRVSFSIDSLRRKELTVQNVRRQNHCVQPTLDALAANTMNVDYFVTHRFPVGRVAEAFDIVAGYRDGVIKAMIDFGETD